jgi:hypothetical protein
MCMACLAPESRVMISASPASALMHAESTSRRRVLDEAWEPPQLRFSRNLLE